MSAISDGPVQQSRGRKRLSIVAAICIALVGIAAFTLMTSSTDYISYWASGKLLIHHMNPYSREGVFALQKAEGYSDFRPLMMRNPPWSLFLVAPLGFEGIRAGLFLWTLMTVGGVVLSVHLLNVPSKERAFAYVFAPAVAAVFMGQSSTFLLLGFCLFLRFHRSRPFWAGASLLLMAIKPHLFLVFWTLLLVDCIYSRRGQILAGAVSAVAAASAFAMYFDAHTWTDYISMMRASVRPNEFFPTASMLFRMLIDIRAVWLLFLPSLFAILWGLWYYSSRRRAWNWRTHGMLLMIVTILASPYAWMTDEAVLLPSILFALTFTEKRKYSAWILLAINTAVLVIALGKQAALSSHAYLWTPVTWLAWFLYATNGFRTSGRPELLLADSPQMASMEHT